MTPTRKRAIIMLFVVCIIWGVATPVIKYGLSGFSPLTFLTYRFGISSLVALLTFLLFKATFPKDKKTRLVLFAYAFLTSTVSLGLLFLGLSKTTVLESALITLVNPLLISIAGAVFLNEHVTKKEKLGMGIAMAGTIFTVIEPILKNTGEASISGNILIFAYLLVTAISAVLAKNLLRGGSNPLVLTNTSFLVGFLTLLPVFFLNNNSFLEITYVPKTFHFAVFYMALISGNLAYFLSNKAQKTVEIGEASYFSYLYPIFSTPLAVIWLGEKITPVYILGGIVVVAGVLIAEVKGKRYNTKS